MKGKFKKFAKEAGGGLGAAVNDPMPADGGGDPDVKQIAKKKTIGKIDGETKHAPRLDRPKRASGGSVFAPAAAKSPMAVAAKGSSGPKKSKGPGY